MGFGILRFQTDGLAQVSNGIGRVTGNCEGDSEPYVGLGVGRKQAQGFIVFLDRFVESAAAGEGASYCSLSRSRKAARVGSTAAIQRSSASSVAL